MSFLPIDTLNLKYAQILLNAGTYTNSPIGTTYVLNSILTNSDKISLSSNTITLQGGCDYFIVSNLTPESTHAYNTLESNFQYFYRLALYDVTNSLWLTQKSTWPQSNSGTTNMGSHCAQLFCVIPARQSSFNIQLRVFSQTATPSIDTIINRNSASSLQPDSCLFIYHN
jgi:hypothetical protein